MPDPALSAAIMDLLGVTHVTPAVIRLCQHPDQIMHGTAAELQAGFGLTAAQARRLTASVALTRCLSARVRPATLACPAAVADLLEPLLAHRDQEELYLLPLNIKMHVLGICLIARGSLNGALCSASTILRRALRYAAPCIILAHNHPTGDPTPSPDDLAFTAALAAAGQIVGIELVDHIIVCPGAHVSLRSMGAISTAPPRAWAISENDRPAARGICAHRWSGTRRVTDSATLCSCATCGAEVWVERTMDPKHR